MFRFYEKSTKDYPNNITITSMEVEVTARELIEKRNLCAKGLLELGITAGEIVSVCMPNTIEAIILLYAINQIGAVSNYVNILKDAEYIQHCISNVGSKILIAFDGVMNKIMPTIDKTKVDKIVCVSAFESLPAVKKSVINILGRLSHKIPSFKNDKAIIFWNDFVTTSQYSTKEIVTPQFVKNQTAFIEYTSGTTNLPKAIDLTNETANQKAIDYSHKHILNSSRGEKFVNIIPLLVAFGIIMGAHGPMCLGLNVEQVLAYKQEDLFKYLKRSLNTGSLHLPHSVI